MPRSSEAFTGLKAQPFFTHKKSGRKRRKKAAKKKAGPVPNRGASPKVPSFGVIFRVHKLDLKHAKKQPESGERIGKVWDFSQETLQL